MGRSWIRLKYAMKMYFTIICLILGHACALIVLAEETFLKAESSRAKHPEEMRLLADLLGRYKSPGWYLSRPLAESNHVVHVNFSLVIVQILDFDEKNNKLETLVWKKMFWHDELLTWDPSEYGNLTQVELMPSEDMLWVPDIILTNNIGLAQVETWQKNIMLTIEHTGLVLWSPPVKYVSSCHVDMTEYPFDVQVCEMVFGSWSYDVTQLDLRFLNSNQIELEQYNENSEWQLESSSGQRNVVLFPCCPHPYVDLTYRLSLRRRVTFHMRLFLIPTAILSILSIGIFWIPPNRPDRSAYGLTLFSSFFLLLILVVNSTPPTSKARIGQFYIMILKLVFSSIVMSIISVNCINSTRKLPPWVDKVFLVWCGCLIGSHRRNVKTCGLSCRSSSSETCSDENCNETKIASSPSSSNNKKWRSVAMVLDRIFFLLYVVLLILTFLFLFPHPDKLFSLLLHA